MTKRIIADHVKDTSEHRNSLTALPSTDESSRDRQQQQKHVLPQYNHLGEVLSDRHSPPPPPVPPRPLMRSRTASSPTRTTFHSTRYTHSPPDETAHASQQPVCCLIGCVSIVTIAM